MAAASSRFGAELAQDVRDVDAGRPDADHEGRRDLAVGVAAGDEGEDLRLARCEAEELEALLRVGRLCKWRWRRNDPA